jgi:sugar phosphate isomerase/epimerase
MAFRFAGFADEAGRDVNVQIAVTRQAGWSAIEVRMIGEKNVCDMTPGEWKRLWTLFQAEGITIACFGSGLCNWSRPIDSDFQVDIDELRRAIPYMHEAGCSLIRIMSYPNAKDDPWPDDKWKAEVFRRLKKLAAIAAGEGIVLAHENCSGYGGQGERQTLEMLAAVDSPALKLILDTGNTTSHDDDHAATLRYYEATKEHVVHVHIKSYKRDDSGKLVTCYPDEDPNQAKILADLKARGYDGWISIEPHLHAAIHAGKDVDNAEQAKAAYVEYARRIQALAENA